jgi:hypothetical protein
MLAFKYDGIFEAYLEDDGELIRHVWIEYNPDGKDDVIRKILDEIYDLFLTSGATKVLVDVRKTSGAFSPEVLRFIDGVQFPRILENTKVRFLATVKVSVEMSALYANLWQKQLANRERLVQRDFSDIGDALAWLRSM